MNEQMNRYLEKVEKYLRPLPAGERMDIVVEIKSGILELQAEGKSPEEIAARLGTPEELARGYLGEAIGKTTRFSFRRLCAVMAFYSLAGAAWLFVLPVTSVTGVSFMLAGALSPVVGLIKFAAHLLGWELPWVGAQFGSYVMSAPLFLPYSILIGAVLFVLGRLLWGFTVKIVRKISAAKAKIGG
ncbi:DUF1700 domain-containing protein [Acutalibacter sp. 1XD8-33]|uniref:DUF1700 domain-containing protein n=1 Tax=Acutalibacter sp. 1XD8-33 TaxID=2320081 RepID=UPI000EA0CABD|nr:DUF1700 domain-containing protein [Acutalibacter sp. 1XD8-33]RKJ40082.1 DUF1700 domain-containing protein [Acutalibacter sp. 1XD8-33]